MLRRLPLEGTRRGLLMRAGPEAYFEREREREREREIDR